MSGHHPWSKVRRAETPERRGRIDAIKSEMDAIELERRRAWHAMDIDHDGPFERCDSRICRGELPLPDWTHGR